MHTRALSDTGRHELRVLAFTTTVGVQDPLAPNGRRPVAGARLFSALADAGTSSLATLPAPLERDVVPREANHAFAYFSVGRLARRLIKPPTGSSFLAPATLGNHPHLHFKAGVRGNIRLTLHGKVESNKAGHLSDFLGYAG